jgi:2'-5' RNA ligase
MAAEPEEHTGGMVALIPSDEHAAQLVHPRGEPQDELHVTLAYLGDDVTGWDMEQRRQVLDAVLAATAGLGPIEGRAFGHTTFNPDGGPDGDRDPCAVYMIGDTPELVPARDAVWAGLAGMDLPEPHAPAVPHLTAGYGLTAADLSYTGPVLLDRLLIALGGEHTVIPLAATDPSGGEAMALLQKDGRGRFRAVPAARAVTASGDQECFEITDADMEFGIVCAGCEHTFEPGEFYAERPAGHQGAYEIVGVVCLACAAADAEAPELPVNYGQDRNLPDPEGCVRVQLPAVVIEGLATGDGRHISPEGLKHRALPLPLMSLSSTGPGGHEGATVCGRIDHLERVPGPSVLNMDTGEPFPEGTFVWRSDEAYLNPEHPDYPAIRNGFLTGISVDLADDEVEFSEDDSGNPQMNLLSGRIAAATVVTIPAFASCHIVIPEDTPSVDSPAEPPAAVAAAAWRFGDETSLCASCEGPPSEWFLDPQLEGPTALTVTPEGRVYGHAASWNVCHIGIPGCVTAPRSSSGYAYFLTGSVITSSGDYVPVGRITLGTGHADLALGAGAAAEHYDNTGVCVADVAAGEDAHGIWLAGAVRPGVTDEQLRALRASPPSGDWRPINGALEMVGVLCVNVPGFPIPRPRARVAAGVPRALVAAGTITNKEKPAVAKTPPVKAPAKSPAKAPTEKPPADDSSPTGAIEEGEVVTIGDTGLQGVVTGLDGDVATVELAVDAAMLQSLASDDAPAADPLAAAAELGRIGGLLRVVRASQIISGIH